MKYQLYMNLSKNYGWLLVVIFKWFVWNSGLELIWFFYDPSWMLQLSEFFSNTEYRFTSWTLTFLFNY